MALFELSLTPITEDEKREIADNSGLSLDANRVQNAPTPGWIVMYEARLTMEGRLKGLTPDAKDTLHALKLLRSAGVGPPTHQRVRNVLETIFLNHDIRLPVALKELAENAFIQFPATQDPMRPQEAYLRYVVSYVEGKHFTDDIDALGQMLENTADAEGLHYLAITLAMQPKDYTEAIRYLRKAVHLREDFHEAWYSMGLTFYELGKIYDRSQPPELAFKAYEQSAVAYNNAVRIHSYYYQAWNNLGIIYDRFGQYPSAIHAYDEAIKIEDNPEPHRSWYNKGSTYGTMNRHEEAIYSFQKAVALKPDYHQAWDNLAWTFVIQEKYDDALEANETARRFAPNDKKYWATYGIVLSHLNPENAVLWLCRAWRNREETHDADAVEEKLREAFDRLGKSPNVCEG